MNVTAVILLLLYALCLGVVCIYGIHRYWLVWVFLRHRRHHGDPAPKGEFDALPTVTVQLPMFNERYVAERIITAACEIDYPKDKLQVQVLDDSTDESAGIARKTCEDLAAAGHNVKYVHRTDRTGFKAGALADGMPQATGEFIAIFDADFVPPRDILNQTIQHFTDDEIGMVQTRWAHLNREDSLLTRVQAMLLDGHFVVEQTARADSGRWFNFNGTAGIWRRQCIEDAGGWQCDTLTEDTDLSYRAQLAGWRFRYLTDVTCPAEVPPTVSAFMSQQHRWNKGLMQTAIKLLPTIAKCKTSLATKIEAFFHLTAPMPYLAVLMLVLLVWPALFAIAPVTDVNPLIALSVGGVCLLLGTLAACTFYVVSQRAQGLSVWKTIRRLPALMAIGVGINVLNSKAIFEAILRVQSPFVRTPKYGDQKKGELDPLVSKQRRAIPSGTFEVLLALVMAACMVVSFSRPFLLVGLPFLLLFAIGYAAIGLPCLRHEWRRMRAA